MKTKINAKEITWWFWLITFVFIIVAISGWMPGYYVVMAISLIQVFYFLFKEKSLMAFPTQIRLVYFAFTLFGFWIGGRLYMYVLLLLGTFMVTFLGRCSIALMLKPMPWNRNRKVRLN